MMRFIASVPFWLVGATLAFFGAAGVVVYARREWITPGTADSQILWGGVVLLIGSGAVLMFAAWVAS